VAALASPPLRGENPRAAGLTSARLGAVVRAPCDSVAPEPMDPLIAAMSAKARLIPGRLLPAARVAPSNKEFAGDRPAADDRIASEKEQRTCPSALEHGEWSRVEVDESLLRKALEERRTPVPAKLARKVLEGVLGGRPRPGGLVCSPQ